MLSIRIRPSNRPQDILAGRRTLADSFRENTRRDWTRSKCKGRSIDWPFVRANETILL